MRGMRFSLLRRPRRLTLMIPFAYFLVVLITVTFSSVILHRAAWHSAQKQVNEAALQTVSSIETNVHMLVDNVNNYSKIIISDANLQGLLREGNLYANLDIQSRIKRDLHHLMQTFPIIDSIFIFDQSGHGFSLGSQYTPAFIESNVEQAPWYDEAVERNGAYLLRLNGSGVFASEAEGNFVSFIRMIRDLDDTTPLGILVINIPESAFADAYSNLANHNGQQFAILDEQHRLITANAAEGSQSAVIDHLAKKVVELKRSEFNQQSSGFFPLTFESRSYTVSWKVDDAFGWTFLNVTPNQSLYAENMSLVLRTLVLLVINGVVFYISSFIISRHVLNPIKQLLRAMKSTKSNKLVKLGTIPNNEEFGQLFIGYNRMIDQINQLLKRIIDEQNTIRKAELSALQAQIKPHFLYNTLDSITSLAMMGQNDQVIEMLEALGSYYRLSVSKGRELITVEEEISMVRNYLLIQKVRYRDLFDVEYEVDKDCLQVPILKLVLQPLVENSLYHGIRNMGSKGTIRISARLADGWLHLSVSDDGVGMTAEQIKQITAMESAGEKNSFGLKGTMERLRIYYNGKNEFIINSEPGKGTTITIRIPAGDENTWRN